MRGENDKRIILDKLILENHNRYLERIALYKSFGYDIEKEREFIIKKSQPFFGNILEVGTGKGYFTLALTKEGYNFTSIDISKEEQELAKLNIKYFGLENLVDFRIENAECISFEDDSFDIVISINVTHHLANPFKAIDEFTRIVTFEGKIIISDFTKQGFEIIDKIHRQENRKHDAGKFNLSNIADYLTNKDFKIERDKSALQELLIAYHPII